MKISSAGDNFFQQPAGNQHVVAEGETTKTIANTHDVSVDALKTANPGLSDFPAVGQSLFIPASAATRSLIGNQPPDAMETGGQVDAFSDTLQNAERTIQQFTLTADLFSFNSDGHLLVKDQDLTNHFRQHLETQTPVEARAVIVIGGKTLDSPEERQGVITPPQDQADLDSQTTAEARAIIIDGSKTAAEAGAIVIEGGKTLDSPEASPLTDELQIARDGFEVHDDGSLLIKDQVVSEAFRNLANAGVQDSKAIIIIC